MPLKWDHHILVKTQKTIQAIQEGYGFTLKKITESIHTTNHTDTDYIRVVSYNSSCVKKKPLSISEKVLRKDFRLISQLLRALKDGGGFESAPKFKTIQEHAAEITAECARIKAAKEKELKDKKLEMKEVKPLVLPRIRIDSVTDDGIVYATAMPRKKKTIAIIKLCPETVSDYSIYNQGV